MSTKTHTMAHEPLADQHFKAICEESTLAGPSLSFLIPMSRVAANVPVTVTIDAKGIRIRWMASRDWRQQPTGTQTLQAEAHPAGQDGGLQQAETCGL